jgi:hypothetical protein
VLRRYVERLGDHDLRRLLGDDGTLGDETLVNFFAFWLEMTPVEKQCLLEEAAGEPRARRLIEVLEFRLYAAQRGDLDANARRMH